MNEPTPEMLARIAPALQPLLAPIDSLQLDPHNCRRHPEANLRAIAASLQRFGQQRPVLADVGRVVRAGNGTVMAARSLGWTHVAVVVSNLDEAALREFAVADNRTAELATWDMAELTDTLSAIAAAGGDGMGAGFTQEEFAAIAAGEYGLLEHGSALGLKPQPESIDHVVEGDVPGLQESVVSRPGDVWACGRHRVVCGDSTDESTFNAAFGFDAAGAAARADLLLTDPPYGVDYVGKTKKALTIVHDDAGGLRALLQASLSLAVDRLRPGGVVYVAGPAGPQFLDFAVVLSALKCWRQTLIWVKDAMVLGRSDYHYKHEVVFAGETEGPGGALDLGADGGGGGGEEPPAAGLPVPTDAGSQAGGPDAEPVLYGWREGGPHRPPVGRCHTTVLQFARPKASREHPTMKPVALWAYLMTNSTAPGGVVLDPFLGSGTTVAVAEQTGRTAVGVEKDPRYADVSVRRWQRLTGLQAVRHDGVLFDAVDPRPAPPAAP